jgi:erythromycin esterase-like protein
MTAILHGSAHAAVGAAARPLTGAPADFDDLIALARHRQFVLLGEASHGTHEFYRVRAEITKRLIREQGFSAVAVEGDWPDAYRVNRYVRGASDDADAEAALSGFGRFPQWMWRNADVLDFVGWLRAHNDAHPEAVVGFYGLDLYSLHASIEAVLSYLQAVDPDAALRAARRYACFDHFGDDPQAYGYATAVRMAPSCEAAVLRQLRDLQAEVASYVRRDGRLPADAHFYTIQNARLVVNAERYYRAMFEGDATSWNLRDNHMAETLDALAAHLGSLRRAPKVVVWAHNSHLGDARATAMSGRGELNLGQLVRAAHGDDALLVGFTTYDGTVTAAHDWGEPMQQMRVQPALAGSYEALFHDTGLGRFYLDLGAHTSARDALLSPRLERAIGVIYRPRSERASHYFTASLPEQFDAVLHFDRTRAVEPLEPSVHWQAAAADLPETYPSSL